jgi:hypothetical protein
MSSKLNNYPPLLENLFSLGRQTTDAGIAQNRDALGQRSTMDVQQILPGSIWNNILRFPVSGLELCQDISHLLTRAGKKCLFCSEANTLFRSRSGLAMLPALLSPMYTSNTPGAQRLTYRSYCFVLKQREALLCFRPIYRGWSYRENCSTDDIKSVLRMVILL